METQIIENIDKLFRSYVITNLLYLGFVVVSILVAVAAIKLKAVNYSRWKNIAIIALVAVCSIGLIALKAHEFSLIYKDYKLKSYNVVYDAKVIIEEGTSVRIDSTNQVVVYDGANIVELKMETDYSLSTNVEYKGNIAYLEHSNFLIWYDFDKK